MSEFPVSKLLDIVRHKALHLSNIFTVFLSCWSPPKMASEGQFNFPKNITIIATYLSLRIVHSSPPKQASKSMYKYLLFLNVVYSLKKSNREKLRENLICDTSSVDTTVPAIFPRGWWHKMARKRRSPKHSWLILYLPTFCEI